MNKYLKLKKIEKIINKTASSEEERQELWTIVEEIIHHKILTCVLDNIDQKHHQEFLTKLKSDPFNEEILDYVEQKGNNKIRKQIKQTIQLIENEILKEI